MSPVHAQDLLKAFRLDATKRRYKDWDDLIAYCAYSAMPVGRFVLDVHGESRATWPASDAICAALQINNHLQDCANDYRDLDRVYMPLDELEKIRHWRRSAGRAAGVARTAPVLSTISRAAPKSLLQEGEALPRMVKDFRFEPGNCRSFTTSRSASQICLRARPAVRKRQARQAHAWRASA